VLRLPLVTAPSAECPLAVLPMPLTARLPAPTPTNRFCWPASCRNGVPLLVMFPAVAVDGARSRWPVAMVCVPVKVLAPSEAKLNATSLAPMQATHVTSAHQSE
jgi:hypothetical protein